MHDDGTALDHAVERLNALDPQEFHAVFAACLDIDRWVRALEAERPFASADALVSAADRHAAAITPEEVGTAIARHPRIGEKAAGSDTESAWSRAEQAGVSLADARTAASLSRGNTDYEERFGHIYLVCANGRSGDELLADLNSRLSNDPAAETRVVAEEFRKIALVRVRKLLLEP
ncbi:2-oxo-4-hydroxy-4-carboxy-5-ureidoimidazoline decarboxylase [Nocardiopsis ansamitocini]|nr:2-oxo-4-hydroxy-4-carboxy-5-ureidoimidazoline decarboxylase [Nocardiopsis ansamitocini]